MPYINLRLGGSITTEQRQKLFAETTLLMNRVMRKRKQVTVVHIQQAEAQQWAVNGIALSNAEPMAAYVDIKVTAGTNTTEEKAAMLSETMKMLCDIVGLMQEACYIVIDEIPADAWGYNGVSQATRAALKKSAVAVTAAD